MLICSIPLDTKFPVLGSKCDLYIYVCVCVLFKFVGLIHFIYRWLLRRGCTGSRNFLDAFRKAVENDEEKAHGIGR